MEVADPTVEEIIMSISKVLAGIALAISAFLTGMYLLSLVLEAWFPPEHFDLEALSKLSDPGFRMKTALEICAGLGMILIAFMPLLQRVLGAFAAGLI